MSKQKVDKIKLNIPAGKANPSPPIGPALGQKGVNIALFCKEFNDKTKDMEPGVPLRVQISVTEDKKFTFVIGLPSTSYYIKKFAKVDKGASATKKEPVVGKISMADCEEIAKIKLQDLNAYDISQAMKIVRGTAESMGIQVGEN